VFSARVLSLSAAYNVLADSTWTESDIARVVEGALAPYRNGDSRIAINGPSVNVTPSNALTLALAVNELATNAVKYGALSMEAGRIAVQWGITQGDGTNTGTLRFEWSESRGPVVLPPTGTGFGSRLISSILAKEFGGAVALSYAPGGLTCTLEAPFPVR